MEIVSIRAKGDPWGLTLSNQGQLGKTEYVIEYVIEYTNLTLSIIYMILFITTKYEIKSVSLGSGNLTGTPVQVDHSEAQMVFLCMKIIFSSSLFHKCTSWWRGK